jgi:hypothetical protein
MGLNGLRRWVKVVFGCRDCSRWLSRLLEFNFRICSRFWVIGLVERVNDDLLTWHRGLERWRSFMHLYVHLCVSGLGTRCWSRVFSREIDVVARVCYRVVTRVCDSF